jgi:hypothetical protein
MDTCNARINALTCLWQALAWEGVRFLKSERASGGNFFCLGIARLGREASNLAHGGIKIRLLHQNRGRCLEAPKETLRCWIKQSATDVSCRNRF